MLFHLSMLYWKNKVPLPVLLETMEREGTIRYQGIIENILGYLTEEERENVLFFISKMYINEVRITQAELPPCFHSSGMYRFTNEGTLEPVCQYAHKAIYQYASNQIASVLKLICKNPSMKWAAFELFVIQALSNPLTVVCSTSSRATFDLRLKVKYNPIHQTSSDSMESIPPGTLIICYTNHPAVDCVLYSEDQELYFIQISLQSYGQHKTKIEDIFEKKLHDTTVYKYYLKKTKNPKWKDVDKLDQSNHNLIPGTHYLFITASKAEQCKHAGQVKFIAAEHLKSLGPDHHLFL